MPDFGRVLAGVVAADTAGRDAAASLLETAKQAQNTVAALADIGSWAPDQPFRAAISASIAAALRLFSAIATYRSAISLMAGLAARRVLTAAGDILAQAKQLSDQVRGFVTDVRAA